MLIESSIKARKDGTVLLKLPSGKNAVFKDKDGVMVCDIKDPEDAKFALRCDGFYPHEDEDDDKQALLDEGKAMGLDVNGRMSAKTIAAKIEEAKAAKAAETGQ